MTEFDLIKLADRYAAISDRLDAIVEAMRAGQIPVEIVAPLVPLLDAPALPPIENALVEIEAPMLNPWLPPWRTSPPDPAPQQFQPESPSLPLAGSGFDALLYDETE